MNEYIDALLVALKLRKNPKPGKNGWHTIDGETAYRGFTQRRLFDARTPDSPEYRKALNAFFWR